MANRAVSQVRRVVRDFGSCLRFSADNQLVSFPNIAAYDFNATGTYSFLIWMNHSTQKTYETLFHKALGGTSGFFIFYNSSSSTGVLTFAEQTGYTSQTVQCTIPIGKWTHIGITYNGTSQTIKFYVNAVLTTAGAGNLTWGNVTSNTTNNLLIGGQTAAATNGLLDEAVITNTEMTLAQMEDAYYRGIYPTKIFHAKMDENSGTSTTDSVNANSGTLTNSPAWSTSVVMIPRTSVVTV